LTNVKVLIEGRQETGERKLDRENWGAISEKKLTALGLSPINSYDREERVFGGKNANRRGAR